MKTKYIVANFSGGKDSTAMVLGMIERGEHIDEVIQCDTYKEFPAMYQHIESIKKIVEDAGIKFTTLRSEKSFDHLMFEEKSEKYGRGRAWPTFKTRWCTGELKRDVIRKYLKSLQKQFDVIQCVGLAADEQYRFERKNNQNKNHRHPLVEWGWTEKDCLQYCYAKGYNWCGLYDAFSRVSCWCCPLKSLEELRKLYLLFPELWEELKTMDEKARNQFRVDYSVDDLEKRFNLEKEFEAQGKSIRNKEFFTELRARLEQDNERSN